MQDIVLEVKPLVAGTVPEGEHLMAGTVPEGEHLVAGTVPGVDTVQVVGSFQAVGGTVLGEGTLQAEGRHQVAEVGNFQAVDLGKLLASHRRDSKEHLLERHMSVCLRGRLLLVVQNAENYKIIKFHKW